MIEVHRVQHPVGQGGFHTAEVSVRGATYRYVYDCGSTDSQALTRALRQYSSEFDEEVPIDLLALSHLDEDHVSGVDQLIGMRAINTVLLPHLHPWERLALIAEACATDALTPSRLELLVAPLRWFRRRGIRDVVLVTPAGPTTGGLPEAIDPELPEDWFNAVREGQSLKAWLDGPEPLDEENRRDLEWLPDDAQVRVAVSGEPLRIKVDGRAAWLLVPYVHPEQERLRVFVDAVAKLLGSKSPLNPRRTFAQLKQLLVDRPSRRLLAAAYELIRRDRNLSSLCLYSGPPVLQSGRWEYATSEPPGPYSVARPGWLATGDSLLKGATRALEFQKHFRDYFPSVGTFVLPHHGSRRNFSHGLFPELQSVNWVASYGRNQYGHPDKALMRALRARGRIVRVNSRVRTQFHEMLLPQRRPKSAGIGSGEW